MHRIASMFGGGIARAVTMLVLLATALSCSASRVVVDEMGRAVTVPDHPHRIICLMPNITDDVFSIGGGDEVVGIIDYVKYPAAALKKPSVGSGLNPSLETILSLHPDLILATPRANPQTVLNELQRLGLTVYLVDPHGMAGLLHTIESIGQATNHETEAHAEIVRLKQRIAAVRARVKGLPAIRVFISFSSDPIFTAGKGAFITELIADAGGESITADLAQEWPVVSLEAVVARAPDALLLFRGGKVAIDSLRQRPGWNSLKAVREGNVFFVDERIGLPSPVAIDALEDLAKQFHP